MLNKSKGITLISLIITILVLIIISAVGIGQFVSFQKVKESTNAYKSAENNENNGIDELIGTIDTQTESNSTTEEKPVLTEEANKPKLASGMIPVKWNESNWVKTSEANENNDWYDYTNQKWANVALVNSNYREIEEGMVIPETEIYAMFVWIPRFVYKIPKDYYHSTVTETSLSSDVDNSNLIDIHFSQTQANGGDTWDSNITVSNEYDTNVNASSSWLTSSAFTFGSTELDGFWMAKFKASDDSITSTESTSKDGVISTVYIKPGRYSEKKYDL